MLQVVQATFVSWETQLNHYFNATYHIIPAIIGKLRTELTGAETDALKTIYHQQRPVSLRTRKINEDGCAILIVKSSIGADSSANGVARIEFEAPLAGLTIEELDAVLVRCGATVQAKWSRERETYEIEDAQRLVEFMGEGEWKLPSSPVTITLDKNAGYGWLAEFEVAGLEMPAPPHRE